MRKLHRPLRLDGPFAFIPLPGGLEARIDREDVHLAEGLTWHALSQGPRTYAVANVRKKTGKGWTGVRLHRLILGADPTVLVDHKNGDGLDCIRANLRTATRSQNAQNTRTHRDNKSGLKGVSWHQGSLQWRASIMHNGKKIYLGFFSNKHEAHAAYCRSAAALHGEFARFS